MADRPHQVQVHSQHQYEIGVKTASNKSGPSPTQVLAVVTLLPIGGTLLGLAGITLTGTLIGLAVTTPLFIIFSPILISAAIVIGLAVAAFITSGACGLTGLSSLNWVVNCLREAGDSVPEQLELAKRRVQEMAGQMGQKTKDVGQVIQNKLHEGERT